MEIKMKKTIYINPVPASRARVTRWSTFFPKKYSQFKKDMETALGDVQMIPTKELISCNIVFYVQIPKSWSKKKKLNAENSYCGNNSDIDNYIKATLDSLNGVFFEDDKQVVRITAAKLYSSQPRIEYSHTEIDYLTTYLKN